MLLKRDWSPSSVLGLLFSAVVLGGPPSSNPPEPPLLTPEKLFEQASGAVVKVLAFDGRNVPTKQGTGFFVSADGLLVTNVHVVAGAKGASVELPGGKSLKVVGIVAASETNDIAILKVEANDLPFLKLSAALPKQGQKVYAIGSPRGLTNTISDGLVSGIREVAASITLLQISVPIAPGSSGGPLLDSTGLVVGVTTAGIRDVGNLNFAVPASVVADLIGKAKTPVPLAEAGVRVKPVPGVPELVSEPPKITATRKADGATVAKAVMHGLGELILKTDKLTKLQVDEELQKIAKTVNGADLTFRLIVHDVRFNEATGQGTVTFTSPSGMLEIYTRTRGVRWINKSETGTEGIGVVRDSHGNAPMKGPQPMMPPTITESETATARIESSVAALTLNVTRGEVATLSKGTLLQLSGPAQAMFPKIEGRVRDSQDWRENRTTSGFCLDVDKYRFVGMNTYKSLLLTINIPRFRITLGSRVLYVDPWLSEMTEPQAKNGEQSVGKTKESVRSALSKSLSMSNLYLTIPNCDKAELQANEAKKFLDANRQLFTAEEYAEELSKINRALNDIASKKRMLETTKDKEE